MPKAKQTNRRQEVLDAASKAVNVSRLSVYGTPEENFARIARLWNVHLINRGIVAPDTEDVPLSCADVAMMLTLLKVARLCNEESHLDSWTDIAGYAACGADVSQDR